MGISSTFADLSANALQHMARDWIHFDPSSSSSSTLHPNAATGQSNGNLDLMTRIAELRDPSSEFSKLLASMGWRPPDPSSSDSQAFPPTPSSSTAGMPHHHHQQQPHQQQQHLPQQHQQHPSQYQGHFASPMPGPSIAGRSSSHHHLQPQQQQPSSNGTPGAGQQTFDATNLMDQLQFEMPNPQLPYRNTLNPADFTLALHPSLFTGIDNQFSSLFPLHFGGEESFWPSS